MESLRDLRPGTGSFELFHEDAYQYSEMVGLLVLKQPKNVGPDAAD